VIKKSKSMIALLEQVFLLRVAFQILEVQRLWDKYDPQFMPL
jgi:hypothetical protein